MNQTIDQLDKSKKTRSSRNRKNLVKTSKSPKSKRGRKPSKTSKKNATKSRSLIPSKVKARMNGETVLDEAPSESTNPTVSTEQGIEQSFMSFFYSDEKFITQFEDNDITTDIRHVYPDFRSKSIDDPTEKKIIIAILENIDLMEYILKTYNMNIFEFFKYLYRQDSSLFKTLFIQRIQRAINGKPYINSPR